MWPFSKPRKTPEQSWWRRLMATEDRCDALEARLDARYEELKRLRGEMYARRRKDAPEPAEEAEDGVQPPSRPAQSAHLAARFRRF